jgi:aarF domain-containing kinase
MAQFSVAQAVQKPLFLLVHDPLSCLPTASYHFCGITNRIRDYGWVLNLLMARIMPFTVGAWTTILPMSKLRRLRHKLGLSTSWPIMELLHPSLSARIPTFCTWDPTLWPLGKDISPLWTMTGYFVTQGPVHDPDGVLQWMDQRSKLGRRVIYAAFGSFDCHNRKLFTSLLLKAAQEHNLDVITMENSVDNRNMPEHVLVAREVPQAQVFPRCDCILHHGGAGTAAQVIRAGKPGVCVPVLNFQHIWGVRLQEYGAGICVTQRELKDAYEKKGENKLTAAFSWVLRPEVAARAQTLGNRALATGGVKLAADMMIAYLESVTTKSALATRWRIIGRRPLGFLGATSHAELQNFEREFEGSFDNIDDLVRYMENNIHVLSLYALDFENKAIVLVECPPAVDLRKSIFVYQTQRDTAIRVVTIPFELGHALVDRWMNAPSAKVASAQVIYIHGTGRCGSTLLQQAMSCHPKVQSLSEPDFFRGLSEMGNQPEDRSNVPDGESQNLRLAKTCTLLQTWLCVEQVPSKPVIVYKLRSTACYQARLLSQATPRSKSIWMYREMAGFVESWCRIIYRDSYWMFRFSQLMGLDYFVVQNLIAFMKAEVPSLAGRFHDFDAGYKKRQGSMLAWSLLYMDQMEAAISLAAEDFFAAILSFEKLRMQKALVVRQLFQALDLPVDHERSVELGESLTQVFETNSQIGTCLESKRSNGSSGWMGVAEKQDLHDILAYDVQARKKRGATAVCDSLSYHFSSTERVLGSHVECVARQTSAAEGQELLATAQQLDWFARIAARLLSVLALFVYWRLVGWTAHMVQRKFPKEFVHVALISKILLVILPFFHWSLAYRRFHIFVAAFIVLGRVKLTRWRVRNLSDKDGRTANHVWTVNDEIAARFLYLSIARLRGLWTKTAQYVSSRGDIMPEPYVRQLQRLQDQADVTPWNQIKHMVPKVEQLTDVDPTPMASASIAQVHTARFKGEKVVLKVQHPHARKLLLDDLWSLLLICRIVGVLEPEFKFMKALMVEWAKEATKELDFDTEAQNLKKAVRWMRKLQPCEDTLLHTDDGVPFQVQVPHPIDEISNNQVLAMSFCHGVRVDCFDKLEEWGLKCASVMNGVVQTFAHMMYTNEIFNGDPHAGNLLVRQGTSVSRLGFTLTVLDWGLAKSMPDDTRKGFCQIVYAAATLDFGLLADGFLAVGMCLKEDEMSRGMELMRFFLRDIVPKERACARLQSRMAADQERQKKSTNKINVAMYPAEFCCFLRVNDLLQGLGARFNLNMSYLQILRPYAEQGLRGFDRVPIPTNSVPPSMSAPADKMLAKKLKKVFADLEAENLLIGAQIYILDKSGNTLADVVHGSLGGLKSHIPMENKALMAGASCSKVVPVTLAHMMVEKGYLSYDEPLCKRVWPAFCPAENPPNNLAKALSIPPEDLKSRWRWKRQITLRHILLHQAGMWMALPDPLPLTRLKSCKSCSSAFEYNPERPNRTILPDRRPGEKSEYHFISLGWLLAGALCGAYACRHGKETDYKEVYEAILAPRVGETIKRHGFQPCGGSNGHPLAQVVTDEASLGTILQMKRESIVMGEENDEMHPRMKFLVDRCAHSFKGKEYLMDPRFWNCSEALEANVPAAGGRFSAAGLAHFYHKLGSGQLLAKSTVSQVSKLHITKMAGLGFDSPRAEAQYSHLMAFGFGYQVFRFKRDKDMASSFGHHGAGGSFGLHHVPSGMSISCMMNKAGVFAENSQQLFKILSEHFDI